MDDFDLFPAKLIRPISNSLIHQASTRQHSPTDSSNYVSILWFYGGRGVQMTKSAWNNYCVSDHWIETPDEELF